MISLACHYQSSLIVNSLDTIGPLRWLHLCGSSQGPVRNKIALDFKDKIVANSLVRRYMLYTIINYDLLRVAFGSKPSV